MSVREAEARGQIAFTRQRKWFDPADHPEASVTMVGCGGIGSFTAFALAKLGIPNLTLVDFDEVEAHNLPNQMFPLDQVGEPKAMALDRLVTEWSPTESTHYCCPLQEMPRPSGVVVSGLDNMAARKDLWNQHIRYNYNVPLYLDGRLGGQHVVIHAVNPLDMEDIRSYEQTLFDDNQGYETDCTARAIIDVGFAVASLITRQVRRHFVGEPVERQLYLDQAQLRLYGGERT